METTASEEKVTIDFSNPPMSYGYDENGIFTQTETCSPDHLESEIKGEAVWLIPANATLIEPPAAVEKHVRVFKNGAWAQVEDNRGTEYWLPGDTWQTEPREMKDLGPLPDGALLERPEKPLEQMSREEIIDLVREAGIVGMGGAGFPTHVKLSPKEPEKITYVIANCAECEPYLTSDYRRMMEEPQKLINGLKVMLKLFPNAKGVLAIEDNKKTAISVLKEKLDKATDIELMVLPTRYPQGAEKQLIQSVTGRQVPSGQLPSAVHCAVFNAATYYAVYRAVCQGKAVTDRIVTVTGEAVRSPRNVLCRIGTSYQELIDAAGGLTEDVWKVVCGGPMMGFAQENLSTVTIKGTNSVLCLAQFRNQEKENPICIRCGRCVQVCPMHLQPLYLFRFRNNTEELKHYHVMDCMECGCCSYTCPGKLPLVESIRQGKSKVKEAAGK